MPKVVNQRVRRHVRAAGADEKPSAVPGTDIAPVVTLETNKVEAGGHIRISKKDKRVLKRQNLMNSLFLPGDVQKSAPKTSRKLAGFNSLSSSFLEALPTAEEIKLMEAEREMKKVQHKTGITAADRVRLKKEKEKYNLVLSHPVFRANPIGTIKEHLQNELALTNASEAAQNTHRKQKETQKVVKKETPPVTMPQTKFGKGNQSQSKPKFK